MEIDIIATVRDILVIGYMLIVRIGVPILITLMIGAWLKRILEKEDEKPQPVAQPASYKHCWETSNADQAQQARTVAETRPDLPCWLALQVKGSGLQESCYSCPLYTQHTPVAVHS